MLISHRHRFIFVHVYKAGGTSIAKALKSHGHYSRLYGLAPHATAREIRRRMPWIFDRYFTFGFVRNPWAFEVSMYNFALRRNDLPEGCSFKTFLRGRAERRGTDSPQGKFLTDDAGRIVVDFVGRLESISEDFPRACSLIGIADPPALGVHNRSTFADWRHAYTDETHAMVAEMSAKDIRLFGYSF